jgi:hypothetical protein
LSLRLLAIGGVEPLQDVHTPPLVAVSRNGNPFGRIHIVPADSVSAGDRPVSVGDVCPACRSKRRRCVCYMFVLALLLV